MHKLLVHWNRPGQAGQKHQTFTRGTQNTEQELNQPSVAAGSYGLLGRRLRTQQ